MQKIKTIPFEKVVEYSKEYNPEVNYIEVYFSFKEQKQNGFVGVKNEN